MFPKRSKRWTRWLKPNNLIDLMFVDLPPLHLVRRFFKHLCASLLVASLAACGGGQVDLLSAIPEDDANEVIAVLINEGIQATKVAGKEGMVGVSVEQAKAAKAVDIMRQRGLPRETFNGMGVVFQKSGLISSPVEERARYLYALSQELSGTLSRIDGVLFARVHLVLPERGSGLDRDTASSAAVFIKHQTGADVEILQPQIRRLVVNSIPGLTLDRVSVVLIPSNLQAKDNTPWVNVFGLQVHPSSEQALKSMVLSLGALLVIALGGAGYMAWRLFLQPPWQGKTRVSEDEA